MTNPPHPTSPASELPPLSPTLPLLQQFSDKYMVDEQRYFLKTTDDIAPGRILSESSLADLVDCPELSDSEHVEVAWFSRLLGNKTKNGLPILKFLGYKKSEHEPFEFNVYSFLNLPYCIRTKQL